jgi:Phage tail tube protein, TTP
MANVKGRGVRVEIAATYAAAKVVTAVTLASPGVATSTAHGLANDTVGYWSGVTGMAQLEGQATRVKNQATNSFELQGLNTTNYSAFTGGNFIPVATWSTLSEATSYSIGGGAAEKLDVTRLIDVTKQEEQGLLPVANVTMNVIAQDTPSAAMLLLESAVQSQGAVVVRITLPNGAVRVFRAEPSLPGEDVQSGQVGTGSLDMAVKGFVLKLAA